MATDRNVVRTIRVKGTSEGVDELAGKLNKLAGAQENVAIVSETSARRQLSVEKALERQQRTLDTTYRSTQQFSAALHELDRAHQQGLTSIARHNELISLASQRYLDQGGAVERAAAALQKYNLASKHQVSAPAINERLGVRDDFNTAGRSADVVAYGRALDDLRAKYNPLFAAGRQYKDAIEDINNAARVGAITEAERRASIVATTGVYERATAALKALAQQQASVNSSTAVNQRLGVRDDFDTTTRSADVKAYGRTLDDLRAKYNPLFAAGRQYKETLDEINQAVRVGAIGETERVMAIAQTKAAFAEHVVQLNTVRASTDKYSTGVGLARYELINLSRQVQDVGVSLASGQSFGTVLVQQGTQIADIFASSQGTVRSFFGQVVDGAKRIFSPVVTASTAMAGIGAAALYAASSWQSGQRDIERALAGVAARSGATVTDINNIAKASASATGLSVSEAQRAATAFAATGEMSTETIGRLSSFVHKFALATGTDAEEATKDLAKAFSGDLVQAAEQLNSKFGGLDGRTREYIRTLQNANDRQGAAKVIIDTMNPSIEKMAAQTGLLSRAWTAVTNAASDAATAMGRALSSTGPQEKRDALEGQIRDAETGMRRMVIPRRRTGGDTLGGEVPGFRGPEDGAIERTDRLSAAVAKLNEQMALAAAPGAAEQLGEIGKSVDNIIRSAIPAIAQMEKLRSELERLREAQGTGGVGVREGMGQEDELQKAIEARQVMLMTAQESEGQAARHNEQVLKLVESYRAIGTEISVSTATALAGQSNELMVAEAFNGQQRLKAQEQSTYNELVLIGKTHEQASLLAAGQRAVAQAQINTQHANTMASLAGELTVAQAVTGAQRMKAQEQVNYNNLIRQGLSEEQASAQAKMQTAVAQAQINTQAEQQLRTLQTQLSVAQAVTGIDRLRAQAVATEVGLLRDGVNARLAAQVAAQEMINAQAQINAQIEQQTRSLEQQTEMIKARLNGTEASVAAEQAYTNAINAGADARQAAALQDATYENQRAQAAANAQQKAQSAAEQRAANWEREREAIAEATAALEDHLRKSAFVPSGIPTKDLYETQLGYYSQFKKGGYESVGAGLLPGRLAGVPGGATGGGLGWAGGGMGGEGGWEINQKGATAIVDKILEQGGTLQKAIDELMKIGLDQTTTGMIGQLIELMPKDQQAGAVEQELGALRQQPVTLAREQLISQLTQKLEQLKAEAERNTDALNANNEILSPLYRRQFGMGFYDGGAGPDDLIVGLDTKIGDGLDDFRRSAMDDTRKVVDQQRKTADDVIAQQKQSTLDHITALSNTGGSLDRTFREGFGEIVRVMTGTVTKPPEVGPQPVPLPGLPPGHPLGGPGLGYMFGSPPGGLGGGPTALRGFANGGSFDVPGMGGLDSVLMSMRVSPREHIIVQPAGSGGRSNGNDRQQVTNNNFEINQNFDSSGGESDEFRSAASHYAEATAAAVIDAVSRR